MLLYWGVFTLGFYLGIMFFLKVFSAKEEEKENLAGRVKNLIPWKENDLSGSNLNDARDRGLGPVLGKELPLT